MRRRINGFDSGPPGAGAGGGATTGGCAAGGCAATGNAGGAPVSCAHSAGPARATTVMASSGRMGRSVSAQRNL
ncbi:MAG: hypothetical protein FJ304_17125 [Planctomycetes bacterium]|nr:hypothetical protein [Planctomycetota bacterium]